jgi:hypothetical protein
MIGRFATASAWCGAGALVVLAARTLAYALVPQATPLSIELERSAGGPRLAVVTVVGLGCAFAAAVAVVGVAALAVRERIALEPALLLAPPRVRPLRVARNSALLFVATSASFAALESYVHWRAGLGWHGVHCLAGPVHRDAVPLLAAVSLVAGALGEAIENLIAWANRTFAGWLQRTQPVRTARHRHPSSVIRAPSVSRLGAALPARGPPPAPPCVLAARAAFGI